MTGCRWCCCCTARCRRPPPSTSTLPTIEALWAGDELPPVVFGCASTPTEGGFYIDWPGGPAWETVVADELPAHLTAAHGADPTRRAVIGASMGGYGALKLVFAHPERYVAAAALSPAVFPGDTVATVPEENRISVLGDLLAAVEASPGDALSTRLTTNLTALRAADGPALFMAVGDHDEFRLQDGTEHLHRAMWDLGVRHEYLVRRGGTHAGQEMLAVQRDALAFIGAALTA